jgi:polysaccharide chain length determinant protein (PEP-CTERM system associated)
MLSMVYGFARAVWHRRWLALAAAWVVALVAWLVIMSLPDRYEASAKVFVDARTPLRPVLEGIAIQEDYESQLALVREALLSRPQLEAVARKTNLDANISTPAEMDALVSGLQSQIEITTTTLVGNQTGQIRDTIYQISYRHPNREKSVEVVRTLLDNLTEGTISGNRSGSSEAQGFLNQQIAELEKRLQGAEGRLADFKKRNIGMIPGEDGDYFSRLNQEMAGLQKAETDLAVALSRRAELKRQLEGSRAYLPGTSNAGSGAMSGAPVDVTLRRQEAEQHLEELLLRYTNKHPEVIATRETIAELKQREETELAEIARGGMGSGAIRSLSVNPVYQQIQGQLNQVQVDIASIQGAAEQHRAEIANLRTFVDQAPEIEQEFARLDRDYGVTKAQYDQLVTRREQARVSDDAARTGIVRFDTIEPPRAGVAPVWPKRPLLIMVSLIAALGLGVGLALLPQLLSPAFSDVTSLERKFGLPVLGSVSEIRTNERRAWEHMQLKKVAIAGLALVALGGLLAVFGGAGARMLRNLIA